MRDGTRDLPESEVSLRDSPESGGDAVLVTDASGSVVWMNGVAERPTGWSNGDASGQPVDNVFRIVHERTRTTIEDSFGRVMREGAHPGHPSREDPRGARGLVGAAPRRHEITLERPW